MTTGQRNRMTKRAKISVKLMDLISRSCSSEEGRRSSLPSCYFRYSHDKQGQGSGQGWRNGGQVEKSLIVQQFRPDSPVKLPLSKVLYCKMGFAGLAVQSRIFFRTPMSIAMARWTVRSPVAFGYLAFRGHKVLKNGQGRGKIWGQNPTSGAGEVPTLSQ